MFWTNFACMPSTYRFRMVFRTSWCFRSSQGAAHAPPVELVLGLGLSHVGCESTPDATDRVLPDLPGIAHERCARMAAPHHLSLLSQRLEPWAFSSNHRPESCADWSGVCIFVAFRCQMHPDAVGAGGELLSWLVMFRHDINASRRIHADHALCTSTCQHAPEPRPPGRAALLSPSRTCTRLSNDYNGSLQFIDLPAAPHGNPAALSSGVRDVCVQPYFLLDLRANTECGTGCFAGEHQLPTPFRQRWCAWLTKASCIPCHERHPCRRAGAGRCLVARMSPADCSAGAPATGPAQLHRASSARQSPSPAQADVVVRLHEAPPAFGTGSRSLQHEGERAAHARRRLETSHIADDCRTTGMELRSFVVKDNPIYTQPCQFVQPGMRAPFPEG